jgi:hypothetical protein
MAELPEDPTGIRYYGGDMTILRDGEVNVELDRAGRVVSVWFRCQALPFTQHVVEDSRAMEMRRMYASPLEGIDAVVLRKDKRG